MNAMPVIDHQCDLQVLGNSCRQRDRRFPGPVFRLAQKDDWILERRDHLVDVLLATNVAIFPLQDRTHDRPRLATCWCDIESEVIEHQVRRIGTLWGHRRLIGRVGNRPGTVPFIEPKSSSVLLQHDAVGTQGRIVRQTLEKQTDCPEQERFLSDSLVECAADPSIQHVLCSREIVQVTEIQVGIKR